MSQDKNIFFKVLTMLFLQFEYRTPVSARLALSAPTGWQSIVSYNSKQNGRRSPYRILVTFGTSDTCVLPVLTYGADPLTLTKLSENKLRVAQTAMERSEGFF